MVTTNRSLTAAHRSRFGKAVFGLLSGIVLLASNAAHGTTYYVSNSGNDSNSGTSPSDPWKTIARVNSQSFVPGDTILFFGGQTFIGSLELTSSGSSTSPVTIGSYGSQRAVISAGQGDGIDWNNAGGITVQDLIFQGSGSRSSNAHGVNFFADQGAYTAVNLRNVSVFGFLEGIYLGAAGGKYSNIDILDVAAHDNGDTGILIDNSEVWPKRSTSNVSIRSSTAYSNGAWGIQVEGVERATIANSVAYGNGDIGMWSWASDRIVFQQDVAHDNGGVDGGFDLDVGTTNSLIQYSYSYDNHGSGYQVCNYFGNPVTADNTIRYNISENNLGKGGEFEMDGDGDTISGLFVYNNTIYHNAHAGEFIVGEYTPARNFIVANNIVYEGPLNDTSALWAGNPMTLDYDDWHGDLGDFWYDDTAYGTYFSFRRATHKEAHGLGVYPGFIGEPGTENPIVYELSPASPLLRDGADLRRNYGVDPGTRDFYGNPLPLSGPFSMGAYQGHSGSTIEPGR